MDQLTILDKETDYTLTLEQLKALYEMMNGKKHVSGMDIGENEPF